MIPDSITVIVVTGLVLVGLWLRFPTLLALGFPALLGLGALSNFTEIPLSALIFVSPLFNYYFLGVLTWALAGTIAIESGLASRHLVGIYALLSRPVTDQELGRWYRHEHGILATLIALLVSLPIPLAADSRYVVILSIPLMIVLSLWILRRITKWAPRGDNITITQVVVQDGKSKRGKSKSWTAIDVVGPDGRAIKINDRTDAIIAVAPLALLIPILLIVLLLTPAGMAELGGIALLWVLIFAFASSAKTGRWISLVGPRFWREVSFVASQLLGAAILVNFYQVAAVTSTISEFFQALGLPWWSLTIVVLILTAVLGSVLGGEAGAILAAGLFNDCLTVVQGASLTDMMTLVPQRQGVILAAAVAGGVLARILPPTNQPSPLPTSPVIAS